MLQLGELATAGRRRQTGEAGAEAQTRDWQRPETAAARTPRRTARAGFRLKKRGYAAFGDWGRGAQQYALLGGASSKASCCSFADGSRRFGEENESERAVG